MIHASLRRPIPVELTDDVRIARRSRRLAAVSVVALGLIWALAWASLAVPTAVLVALALGWILMPTTLVAGLVVPAVRYLLVVPASLVTAGLVAICAKWLPASPAAATGWLLLTAGIALGGLLGIWLWFRVVPVPAALDDPESRGRWGLIGVHVTLVVAGWLLAALAFVLAPGR